MVKKFFILFVAWFLFNSLCGCVGSNDEILDYMNLSKGELIKKLGNNYKKIQTGPEGMEEGYYYSKIGITVVFDDTQQVGSIYCTNKATIKGARAGMSFKQIQKALGKTKIYEIFNEESNSYIYQIRYIIDNCNLIFMSEKADGSNSSFSIHRISATWFSTNSSNE